MSAPTDSSTPDDTTIIMLAEASSPLQQPKDAVPMKSMPQQQQQQPQQQSSDLAPVADATTTHATTAPSSSAAAVQSKPDSPEQSFVPPPASPKGKEKEAPAPPPPPAKESQDVMAIGPAVDDVKNTVGGSAEGPVCKITLLLTSGSRHPYKIDAKYLHRRNVEIPDKTDDDQPDPFSISVYTLKELILREWRSDWEAKPASPSSIRLIHFGKLLDDKEPLKSKPSYRYNKTQCKA